MVSKTFTQHETEAVPLLSTDTLTGDLDSTAEESFEMAISDLLKGSTGSHAQKGPEETFTADDIALDHGSKQQARVTFDTSSEEISQFYAPLPSYEG
jgi:hypothetical protein